jgi:hypothetical protein
MKQNVRTRLNRSALIYLMDYLSILTVMRNMAISPSSAPNTPVREEYRVSPFRSSERPKSS